MPLSELMDWIAWFKMKHGKETNLGQETPNLDGFSKFEPPRRR